ncbi:hypothetical protein NUACC26_037310 [Scytonema sp. NUACC26]
MTRFVLFPYGDATRTTGGNHKLALAPQCPIPNYPSP